MRNTDLQIGSEINNLNILPPPPPPHWHSFIIYPMLPGHPSKQYTDPLLGQCLPAVFDVGPTLTRHWVKQGTSFGQCIVLLCSSVQILKPIPVNVILEEPLEEPLVFSSHVAVVLAHAVLSLSHFMLAGQATSVRALLVQFTYFSHVVQLWYLPSTFSAQLLTQTSPVVIAENNVIHKLVNEQEAWSPISPPAKN